MPTPIALYDEATEKILQMRIALETGKYPGAEKWAPTETRIWHRFDTHDGIPMARCHVGGALLIAYAVYGERPNGVALCKRCTSQVENRS